MGQRNGAGVLIIGAGPAGLVLGNVLRADGIDTVILERRSRSHVEHRARAGFLAANSVRILDEHGLSAGLHRDGAYHDTCAFRGDHGQFELNYSGLGRGEVHTVYPQQNLVRDLIAEFLDRGGRIEFDTPVLGVHGVDTEDPWVATDSGEWHARFIAGADGQHGVAQEAMPAARRMP